jgi:hypothetical protein
MSSSSSSGASSDEKDSPNAILDKEDATVECEVFSESPQAVKILINRDKTKIHLFTVTRASTDGEPSAASASSASTSENSATTTNNDKEKPQAAVVDVRASVFKDKVTATWDPRTNQFQINIKDVCWTRQGEKKDSSLSVESLSKGGKVSTTVLSGVKSESCEVSSKKVIVGIRILESPRQVRLCTKTVSGTCYNVPDQEFFHVSKLPLGGLETLYATLRPQWLAAAMFDLVFSVYCDDSYDSRATRTTANLLGFTMRSDHHHKEISFTKHLIAPKQLIDWIRSWPERHIEGFGRFLAMFDCLTFTYLSDVDTQLVGAEEAVKKYMVKCLRTTASCLSSPFPPKESDFGLVSKIDDFVLKLTKSTKTELEPEFEKMSLVKDRADE